MNSTVGLVTNGARESWKEIWRILKGWIKHSLDEFESIYHQYKK